MKKIWHIPVAALFVLAAPAAAVAARGYATTDVNMRAGPGTGYPVVETVPADAHLNIHGCLSDGAWCDVSWHGERGWVSADHLDYYYRNRYVYFPDYVDVIDYPVVWFDLDTYWDDYYGGEPWFGNIGYWGNYWRSHGRYGERGHVHERRIAHNGMPAREHALGAETRGRTALGRTTNAGHAGERFGERGEAGRLGELRGRRPGFAGREARFGGVQHFARGVGGSNVTHFAAPNAARSFGGFRGGAVGGIGSVGRGAFAGVAPQIGGGGFGGGAAPHFAGGGGFGGAHFGGGGFGGGGGHHH